MVFKMKFEQMKLAQNNKKYSSEILEFKSIIYDIRLLISISFVEADIYHHPRYY